MPIRVTRNEPVADAWFLLHQTYESVAKCEENALADIGLSLQQYLVLRVLKHAPEPVTLTVVSNWLDRNHNTISSIVNRMEKAGLLKRAKNPEDGRSSILVITPKGEKAFRNTYNLAEALPHEVLSVLSIKELNCLNEQLLKVRENTFKIRQIVDKVIDVDTSAV